MCCLEISTALKLLISGTRQSWMRFYLIVFLIFFCELVIYISENFNSLMNHCFVSFVMVSTFCVLKGTCSCIKLFCMVLQ